MTHRMILIGTLFLSFVSCATGHSFAEEAIWKAGIATARITPEKPLWMAGYSSRTHAAEGTLHDLWVKVLALEASDGHRAVVVTSDLLGFPRAMADSICRELRSQCGLERSQILLTCSHTHCGPVLYDALQDCYPLDDEQRAAIDAYSSALEKTVVTTVAQALAAMKPATVWAGDGRATFAVNRRNNSEAQVVKKRQSGEPLRGPVDHSVPVLVVRDLHGGLQAIVFGYACHNTTLSFYQWCGDYAGFAQLALEQAHPGAVAMFYAGCGADQNPLPRRSVELCRQYGAMLAAAVGEVLDQPMRPIAPQLKTAFATVDLEFQPLPPASELQALAKTSGYRARWAARMLALTAENKRLPKSYPCPLQVWKLGSDQLWIAIGGEVVVDYALMLKARYGSTTWVAGYANDVMAYLPSRRIWEEGGYEQGAFEVYGLPAKGWTGDVEERVLRGIDQLVRQVNRSEAKQRESCDRQTGEDRPRNNHPPSPNYELGDFEGPYLAGRSRLRYTEAVS